MTGPTPCTTNGCEAQVLVAQSRSGTTLRLDALPSRKPRGDGRDAVRWEDDDGVWWAMVLKRGETPGPQQALHRIHVCRTPGTEAVRQARSSAAHRQRAARGRPPSSSPLRGAVGVRWRPPGGDAA
jgi:hypothetical protein